MAEGHSNRAIAEALELTERSVEDGADGRLPGLGGRLGGRVCGERRGPGMAMCPTSQARAARLRVPTFGSSWDPNVARGFARDVDCDVGRIPAAHSRPPSVRPLGFAGARYQAVQAGRHALWTARSRSGAAETRAALAGAADEARADQLALAPVRVALRGEHDAQRRRGHRGGGGKHGCGHGRQVPASRAPWKAGRPARRSAVGTTMHPEASPEAIPSRRQWAAPPVSEPAT